MPPAHARPHQRHGWRPAPAWIRTPSRGGGRSWPCHSPSAQRIGFGCWVRAAHERHQRPPEGTCTAGDRHAGNGGGPAGPADVGPQASAPAASWAGASGACGQHAGQVWCQPPIAVNGPDVPGEALGRAGPSGRDDGPRQAGAVEGGAPAVERPTPPPPQPPAGAARDRGPRADGRLDVAPDRASVVQPHASAWGGAALANRGDAA